MSLRGIGGFLGWNPLCVPESVVISWIQLYPIYNHFSSSIYPLCNQPSFSANGLRKATGHDDRRRGNTGRRTVVFPEGKILPVKQTSCRMLVYSRSWWGFRSPRPRNRAFGACWFAALTAWLRHEGTLDTSCCVRYNGAQYDITRIDVFEGYKKDLTLYCKRR